MGEALNQAVALHRQGRLDDAERGYRAVLAQRPDEPNALHLLGVLLQQRGRPQEAASLLERVLAAAPGHAAIHNNYGNALKDLGRLDEAAAQYRHALALDPGFVDANWNLGRLLKERGALAEAVQYFEAALAQDPVSVELLNELGLVLQDLGRFDRATERFRVAAALAPNQPVLHHNLGNALTRLGDFAAAEASLRQALALAPDLAETAVALGNALKAQGRLEAAIECYARASALAPGHVLAWYNLGCVYQALKRHDQAAASFERALALAPDHAQAFDGRITARLQGCDWNSYDTDLAAIEAGLAAGATPVAPFASLILPLSPAAQFACARSFVAATAPPQAPIFGPRAPGRNRLHLAYVSADFHRHATAYLTAGLFERHDRAGFEVTGISLGPDDGSDIRRRLETGFDRFLDLGGESEAGIARRISELGVDIAIDLKGHTKDNRFGLFAHRPAPIQVAYLGYPGTTGAPYIDYVIADPIVLPFDQQRYWTERIVHLPDCYQVNDTSRATAPDAPSRAQCGLPAQGFVFCCFNNPYKLTPAVFAVWMRLLHAVPGSVLWLYCDNGDAERRLRATAAGQGVDPVRLVFAGRLAHGEHLARQEAADLFLDTLPCNAHTTAGDALRAGLPVLTCRGESFAGRVASSLLTALGLEELVAGTLAEYEALALRLAREPPLLARLRARLRERAASAALFDGDQCRRQLEAAYREMWRQHRRGEAPRSFRVDLGGGEYPRGGSGALG
jgi:predicted O-linked N-acetylglucosamine transferase (SPINDLY family)